MAIKQQKTLGTPAVEGCMLRPPTNPEGADPPLPPQPKANRLDKTIGDLLEVVPAEGRDQFERSGKRSWFIPGRKNEAGRR